MEVCKYHRAGTCKRGDKCKYLHEGNEAVHTEFPNPTDGQSTLRADAPDFHPTVPPVCRFFREGRCRAGNDCRFSHPPHDDEAPHGGNHEALAASGNVVRSQLGCVYLY